jgi:iron complex transport system substrate-binding protein
MKWLMALLLAGSILTGCKQDVPRHNAPYPRTVSFSPAITTMLFEMGLSDHIVGVTSYCAVPEEVDIPVVGNQLNIRAEPIVAVEPDVLFTQTTPNRFETIRKLRPDIRIEYFRIETLTDIGDTMARVATALGREKEGDEARRTFLAQLDAVRDRVAGRPRPRVIFVMGHYNPSTAGRATFIHELIDVAGGTNAAAERYDGWKSTGIESILELAPDVIVCLSEAAAADEALGYWQRLVQSSDRPVHVHVVTDKRWTLPIGWQAQTAAGRLAEMIHHEVGGETRP